MYVKIEGTGCCEHKGMVQVRFCMYLDPTDYGYEKHHIQVPDLTGVKYEGKVDKDDIPVDFTDCQKWLDSLPKVWQNNPFHNHFIYVEPTISDNDLSKIGDKLLADAYALWEKGKEPYLLNDPIAFPVVVDNARLSSCNLKVALLKVAK